MIRLFTASPLPRICGSGGFLRRNPGGRGRTGEEDGKPISGEGDFIHRSAVKPNVAVRAAFHFLHHILQRSNPDLFLPLHQELDINVVPVGLRGVVGRLTVVGLEGEEEISPFYFIQLILQGGKSVVRSSSNPR